MDRRTCMSVTGKRHLNTAVRLVVVYTWLFQCFLDLDCTVPSSHLQHTFSLGDVHLECFSEHFEVLVVAMTDVENNRPICLLKA